MRTDKQMVGPAGPTDFMVGPWRVVATWTFINERVECSSLTIDSDGKAAINSAVVREIEVALRKQRAKRVRQVRKMAATAGGDVGRRAARQVSGYEKPPSKGKGSRRDDELWRQRALVMQKAWEAHKPMAKALEKRWPHRSPDTYRKWIDRAREWDRETGAGLLNNVGRPRTTKGKKR